MKKKTVLSVMAVAILFAVSLFFVGGTYARYTSKFTGETNVDIAKWAVKVGGQNAESATNEFTPTFTYDANAYVANNKLAPNRTMSANIELDLTGTEVAVDVIANIDTSALKTKLGDSVITTKVTMGEQEVTGEEGQLVELSDLSAFTAENGVKTLKVTITWDNAEDAHNDSDTKLGIEDPQDITIPIELTVQQHIAE